MSKKLLLICLVSLLAVFSSKKATAQFIDTVEIASMGCDMMKAWVWPDTTLNVSVAIDFGDGTSDTLSTDSAGIYAFYHSYPWPGSYPVLISMFQANVLVDTQQHTFVRDTTNCAFIYNKFYFDFNNNCLKDNNEPYAHLPFTVEIQKNSVAIDTFNTQNGHYFFASGNMGDVFTSKVISAPSDVTITCPLSATISNTLNFSQPFHNYFGLNCATTNAFDFGVGAFWVHPNLFLQHTRWVVTNPLCDDPTATATLTFSPKYQYTGNANPAPTSVNGNVLTWNINNLGATGAETTFEISVDLYAVGTLTMGDTVQNYFTVIPTTGDAYPANNSALVVDTITAAYDPNAIYVKPEGCVLPGTNLEYTITFENLGNGPAQNVYVLDTLPAGLDRNSFKVQFSSHDMFVGYREIGPYTILKFDFPDIMLADSSDHVGRCGGLMYTIDSKNTLPLGYMIDHRVGIYFDTNPVVLTNTASTGICWLATENIAMNSSDVEIYPNPATESITVKAKSFDYNSYTISNCIGQTVSSGSILSHNTKINLHQIPAGLYYLALSGRSGTVVHKFQKL